MKGLINMARYKTKTICKCQRCGKDADVDDSIVLTSYPPKYSYHCPHCNYNGYVFCSETISTYTVENVDDLINEETITKNKSDCLNGDGCCISSNESSTIKIDNNYVIHMTCAFCGKSMQLSPSSNLFIAVCDECKEAIEWAKRELN